MGDGYVIMTFRGFLDLLDATTRNTPAILGIILVEVE